MALTKLFRETTEEFQAKQGFCILLDDRYDTIRAKQIDASTGKVKFQNVHYRLNLTADNEAILVILDGVTGYESWYIYHLLAVGVGNKDEYDFCACAGTRDRWDELWLNSADVWAVIETAIDFGIVQID